MSDCPERVAAARVKELECELNAWHRLFGTSQLSHAAARLESLEAALKKLEAANERLKSSLENLIFQAKDCVGCKSYPEYALEGADYALACIKKKDVERWTSRL